MGARKQIARRKIRIPPKGQQTKEMKFVGTYNPPILWCLRISVCVWGQLSYCMWNQTAACHRRPLRKTFADDEMFKGKKNQLEKKNISVLSSAPCFLSFLPLGRQGGKMRGGSLYCWCACFILFVFCFCLKTASRPSSTVSITEGAKPVVAPCE